MRGTYCDMAILLWLRHKYEVEKKSIMDISRELSIPRTTIEQRLHRAGTIMRTFSEALLLPGKTGKTKGRLIPCKHRPIGFKRTTKSGYVFVKTERGWIQEHRIVMEQMIGRRLNVNEIPHHKDEVKSNNDPNNLELLPRGKHTKKHHVGCHRSKEACSRISAARVGKLSYDLHPSYKHITPQMILEAISSSPHKKAAAKLLGISDCTLYNKIHHFKIEKETGYHGKF